MITKFIEVTHGGRYGGNWGKFLLARFEEAEWRYRSTVAGQPLLLARGWAPHHLLFLDIETCEGAVLSPGGSAHADLHKHRIWVCPMAEPFLEWLYQQDLSDLSALPSYLELPEAKFALAGYRRPGPPQLLVQELEDAVKDMVSKAENAGYEGNFLPDPMLRAIEHAQTVLNRLHEAQTTCSNTARAARPIPST